MNDINISLWVLGHPLITLTIDRTVEVEDQADDDHDVAVVHDVNLVSFDGPEVEP